MENLFKAYDIRGIYPSELTLDFAYKLGRAVAMHFTNETIIVGRDARIGSDRLAERLIAGINDQGSNVIDIGLCSTPMLYFATQKNPGVMITASHNPKEYNGFKICAKGGSPLGFPDGLSPIRSLIEQANFGRPKHKGKTRKKNILDDYAAHVRKFKDSIKKLKVVIDAGNSVEGIIAPKVFARLPAKVIPLFFELDGNFPNRPPNPLKEGALDKLCEAVKKNKADIGIAYDGDCDRVIFVDEKGKIARPDHILVLLAQYLLKENPHAKILYDVRCSRIVKEKVTEARGVAIMTRVGHTYISHIMKEENALLAGELSGHYYFKENFWADSGDIPVMLMLNIISREKKPLSRLLAPLQKYFNSGELNFTVENKHQAMKRVEEEYSERGKVYHIDGLTVEFPDWWFNLRSSHTEPVLRLNVEASTKALLDRKVAELRRFMH
ncbi:MAG: phosphomannomutase/phosphoglucomutase [Candidatus Woesearchaeota archaeon]